MAYCVRPKPTYTLLYTTVHYFGFTLPKNQNVINLTYTWRPTDNHSCVTPADHSLVCAFLMVKNLSGFPPLWLCFILKFCRCSSSRKLLVLKDRSIAVRRYPFCCDNSFCARYRRSTHKYEYRYSNQLKLKLWLLWRHWPSYGVHEKIDEKCIFHPFVIHLRQTYVIAELRLDSEMRNMNI